LSGEIAGSAKISGRKSWILFNFFVFFFYFLSGPEALLLDFLCTAGKARALPERC